MKEYYAASILKDKGFETATDVILNLQLLPDVVTVETDGKKKIIADSINDFMETIKNFDNRDAFERISRLMNAQSKIEHKPYLYNTKTNEYISVTIDEYEAIKEFKAKPQNEILNTYRDTLAMMLLGRQFNQKSNNTNKLKL